VEHSVNRVLTTHAGSLPRPKALTALHIARSQGEAYDAAALEAAAEEATREVIAKQIEAGLDVINNGEVGRESFITYVQHRMSGFGGESARGIMGDLPRYPGFLERFTAMRSAGKVVSLWKAPQAIDAVQYTGTGPIEVEVAQLQRLLGEQEGKYSEAFMSAASPGIVAAAMQNAHYDSVEEYVRALAAALSNEYRAIVEAGFVLQIDAPDLAMERHNLFLDKSLDEFRAFVRVVIDATNEALAGLDPERVRLHVCWGNYEGPHDLDVPLAEIWEELERAQVGGFLLSMANPRHAHEYQHFERVDLPDGCVIVPGVIDTTTNYIEHPEAVADRIEKVVKAVGDPTRVLAGTDCGFETSAGMASVDPGVAWAKFRALADGAAIASSRIFGS